jgi:hypothetical protein
MLQHYSDKSDKIRKKEHFCLSYDIYSQWGTKFYKTVKTEKEAWDAIGTLPFGEGYSVFDSEGNICSEFIPF